MGEKKNGKNELTVEENALIESLIKIATAVNVIYTKLYKLEIENKKENDEYKQNLDYLSIILEFEEKKYAQLLSDTNKSNKILQYFLNSNKIKSEDVNPYNAFQLIDKNIVAIRIIYILSSATTKKNNIIEETENSVINEILLNYIIFSQKTIDEKKFEPLNEELIKTKYDLAFINKYLETKMLLKNYPNLNTLYSNYKENYLLKNHYQEFKNIICASLSKKSMTSLYSISNFDYSNKSNTLLAIVQQNLLKAALSQLDDDTISEIKDIFEKLKLSKEYSQSNRIISESLITDSFQSKGKQKL